MITPLYIIAFYSKGVTSISYLTVFGLICVLIILSPYIKNKTYKNGNKKRSCKVEKITLDERIDHPPDAIEIVFISIYSILAGFAMTEIMDNYGKLLLKEGFNMDYTLRL